jgi:glyoxylate reductase
VDVKTASDLGIIVTNTPVNSETVVDTTIGLIFAISRNISKADSYIKSGNWKIREERRLFTGTDVFGKKLGIIGLGRIGSILAKRVKCLDMDVFYYDVIRKNLLEHQLGLKFLNLTQLLTQTDFISIHTPLTENTKGLIGKKELKMMKKTAILINTSRGPVINEKALIMALEEGWIAGAGLDVFEEEPIKNDNPLLKLDNVVLTPHIGGGTIECERRVVKTAIENTILVLKGKDPLYSVN